MSLELLKLVSKSSILGVPRFLLVPDLPLEQSRSSHYRAIALAAFWRLRRERPYVVAFCEDPARWGNESDLQYALSVPQLQISVLGEIRHVSNVGIGDISPFLSQEEDDFLLFLANPPPPIVPAWPNMVTELDGVLVGQCDEFITLQTVDPEIMSIIEALPEARL